MQEFYNRHRMLSKQLQKTFENTVIEIYELSPVFIAQGGPGCIAVQTIRK